MRRTRMGLKMAKVEGMTVKKKRVLIKKGCSLPEQPSSYSEYRYN